MRQLCSSNDACITWSYAMMHPDYEGWLHGHRAEEKKRQEKTKQDKTRQDKTRQDKTRQDKRRC